MDARITKKGLCVAYIKDLLDIEDSPEKGLTVAGTKLCIHCGHINPGIAHYNIEEDEELVILPSPSRIYKVYSLKEV